MSTELTIASILMFAIGMPLSDRMPKIGYMMTFPLRLLLPFAGYDSLHGTIDGLCIGLAISFLLSFEHTIFWKLGLLCFIVPSLCR